MKVTFLSVAETELAEALSYYEEQLAGLGIQFAAEVDTHASAAYTSCT